MAKNAEKIERNKIRAQYERKYAAKLKQKDETIAGLLARIAEKDARIKQLEEKASLDGVTIQRLDELVKTMQAWLDLPDGSAEKFLQDAERRAKAHESFETAMSLLAGLGRGLGPY